MRTTYTVLYSIYIYTYSTVYKHILRTAFTHKLTIAFNERGHTRNQLKRLTQFYAHLSNACKNEYSLEGLFHDFIMLLRFIGIKLKRERTLGTSDMDVCMCFTSVRLRKLENV